MAVQRPGLSARRLVNRSTSLSALLAIETQFSLLCFLLSAMVEIVPSPPY